jgi:hypothetical protein
MLKMKIIVRSKVEETKSPADKALSVDIFDEVNTVERIYISTTRLK